MDSTRDEYRQFHERRHRMMLGLLSEHVTERVERCLDIGGGGDIAEAHAWLKECLAEELYAVDLGADVELGRQKGTEARRCNVDAEPLPYGDGYFDIVLFASVIEHLYNPHHVVEEIARVMKPGGVMLVETPNAVAFGRRLDALFGKNAFSQFNEYNAIRNKAGMEFCSVFYTIDEVEALLAPCFRVVDRRYGMHTPKVNFAKAFLRETVFRVRPGMADYFVLVARRKGDAPHRAG